jgi:HSP20 family molecular chaperone IbpA
MDENNWVIQLALSGYDKTNILIEENNGRLIVSGKHPKKESETESKKYIHRGIAMR